MKRKTIVLLLTTALCLSTTACIEEPATPQDTTVQKTVADEADTIEVTDPLTCPAFTAEKNSNEMIDQIVRTARDYAESLTDDQVAEIISIIREADHKFYNGPEEMEKFMWYGYLLDYKYDDSDPRSELGTDLCQAIKYVYRNVETVLDDATHENLLQIDESLAQIQ